MTPRQSTIPSRWLVADDRLGERLWPAVRMLPAGSGVLFLYRKLRKRDRARLLAKLRRVAQARRLVISDEASEEAARVHNAAELRRASSAKVPLLFLSPIYPTRSHPDWRPIPPMRTAALLRLARAPVIALGGMDELRFRRIGRLGFSGWAGIDAWI